jgi:GAF domain-containing protein
MGAYISDMYDLCSKIAKARDLDTTLNILVKSITGIMGVKGSSIRLLDERTQTLRIAAAYGLSKSYIDKGPLVLAENPVEREVLGGRMVSTKDVTQEPDVVYREEAAREGIKSILSMPLMAGDRAIGIIRIYTSEPHEFTPEEVERLRALSSFGGIIVDRAKLWDEMRALICIAHSISSTLSLEEVLQIIVENAARALGMRASSISLLDGDGKLLDVKAAYGLSSAYLGKGPVELDKSPVDKECLEGMCSMVPDISKDTGFQYPEEIAREGIRAMLSVPLKVKGKAIGVLRVYASIPYEFSPSEIEFLTTLASYGAIAIENARLYEHVKNEYEELTKDVWKWYDWGSRFPNI